MLAQASFFHVAALALTPSSPSSRATLLSISSLVTTPRSSRQSFDAGAPHVAHIALVGELVSKVRPAQERHAVQHAFHGRVPPAVRHETGGGRVREHALLRRPANDQPLALDAALERVKPTFYGSGGEIWPDDPQERLAREREPVGKLLELLASKCPSSRRRRRRRSRGPARRARRGR